MKLKLFAAALVLAASAAAVAQAPRNPPKLIVAISVDQFSGDLFAEYRQYFTGGLRRLSEGAVFPAGFQSHAATETCPGHSTILTGARPARTGIIANNWFDLGTERPDKLIYCAEDERVPGSNSEDYTPSGVHLRVPTLGDLMRRRDPRSRVVAVAGKDRAAIMMSGHNPTQRWFRSGTRFVSDRETPAPAAVASANQDIARRLAETAPPMALPAPCQPRSRAVPVGPAGRTVGDGRFGHAAGDGEALLDSPEYDEIVLGLAEGISGEMRLGQGAGTDLLIVGLSATDYVGHRFGTQGSEMCIQLLALDRMLGGFFDRLDTQGIDYAVVLTADHGGHDLPERVREQAGGQAERADADLRARVMGPAIGQRLGLPGQLIYGDSVFGDFYVDRALAEADRRRVLDEAVQAYRAHPHVAAVFTRVEIEAAPAPAGPPDTWSVLQRIRASFDAERSGDFYVVLKPRVTPIPTVGATGSIATHGSVWDYDRRVPILFWRRGMTAFEQPLSVETVDIMPTLAGLIGLPLAPGSVDGRCLDLDPGPATTCPR
ncbi:alkaline phosphatase family protein [Sphingosinicella sp. LHD-64]|uniref:alkaline phosphatase family protein n=1 Tax=Sphingosinicella sp. LHD-64 TaxID=3072139 RepID=UPI002810159A|nr:alkaline phosphatase family protein [Sphingosinicella sp. LHD-64]MDQ8755782.1 alkaline phosphatase family protein [Sphingosinicella sp. LHD-64]